MHNTRFQKVMSFILAFAVTLGCNLPGQLAYGLDANAMQSDSTSETAVGLSEQSDDQANTTATQSEGAASVETPRTTESVADGTASTAQPNDSAAAALSDETPVAATQSDADADTQLATQSDAPDVWDGKTISTGWYDAAASSYTISNGAQLAGLAYLVNHAGYTLKGKTITLANDIYLNASVVSTETAGQNLWTPISDSNHFGGTFDGGGHIVYNMYCV